MKWRPGVKKYYPFWTAAGVTLADKIIQGIVLSGSLHPKDMCNYGLYFYPVVNDYNVINTPMRILLLLLLSGCLFILAKYRSPCKDFRLILGAGLVAGGAFSNGISWILQGSVVDYIGFFYAKGDLIVNLADLAYVLGAILVILGVAREVIWMLGKIRRIT